jgi:hypothetical protein
MINQKIMKIKILIGIFFSTFAFLNAQNSVSQAGNLGSISGKVIDKNSKQPISYVNISIKQTEKFITGGITQDNGNFTIKNLELKEYVIEFQYIGYKKQSVPVSLTINYNNANLNTILLEEEAIQLEGVEIVNERFTIIQKIDRKAIAS